MRDGQAPRGFAAASIKTPGLPGGTEERFAGYGVIGLPFRSGHYLALRHFPAGSIGPGFRAVWHRDPHRRWTFYADAPAEVSCARYFGATTPGGAERVPIDVTWTGPRSLRVTVPDVLAWEVHLAATAATRLLSSASRAAADPPQGDRGHRPRRSASPSDLTGSPLCRSTACVREPVPVGGPGKTPV
jgi:hypothetical protein